MSIFYVNNEKDVEGNEYFDKFDLGKFIDGHSDAPEDAKQRVRIAINKDLQQ